MVASRYGFGHLVEQLGLLRFVSMGKRLVFSKNRRPLEQRLSTPERLRLMFEELGPSFIKLGQVLSCRPDLLPIEYAQELCKLTDSVSPFPFEDARSIVEHDLGAPLSRIFLEFDPVPIAAASIAQVHRAKLLDNSDVMVKIQRPHIDRIIAKDISILEGIAELIEAYAPEMAVYNPRGIVEEFARTISRELDFYIEASNAIQLRNNFEHSEILYVPRIFDEVSSKRVLVLERIEGIRIDDFRQIDLRGFDRKELAKKGASAFFQMVLRDGLFHADPHPGNIFVLSDGRIGLVDFGIMGRVNGDNMEHFANLFIALSEHDYDTLVRQYVNLGFLSEEYTDLDKFQREMKEDLAELLEPYYGMKVKQIDFGAYVARVMRILTRYNLKLPQNLYLMDKALLTLEGILKQLDPEFDYFASAKPYVVQLIKDKRSPLRMARVFRKNMNDISDTAAVLPRQMGAAYRKFMRGDVRVKIHHEGMQHFIRDLDRSSNRLAFSIITAAIIVASSIIIHAGQGQKLFGMPIFGVIGYTIAGLFGIWILIGILRSGQL